ncbi:two-component sensor histidine kinase [Geitlerinema sp. FC II]|nr:two-component sensor histidine kinase [Geitlerinema sp. FC II]
MGTVCAIDRKPRQLNSEQLRALRALSRQTIAQMELRRNVQQLNETLRRLQHTQASLIHTEKMSALGQFVAGIAHEINNPISFIAGNLPHAHGYSAELIRAIELYRQVYPNPPETILEEIEAIDLDYLAEDFPKLLDSMKFGADRIQKIVESLRMFSHLDEAEIKTVDLHQQLENTLNIAGQRFQATETRGEIRLIRDFGDLPPVTCAVGQLNQVFLNLIANAIDAIDARSNYLEIPEINIKTEYFQGKDTRIRIQISDNGIGISEELSSKIFEPFFTTKSVGQGTGIGLSTSYQIVTKTHGGQLYFKSKVDIGTLFVVEIPVSIDASK